MIECFFNVFIKTRHEFTYLKKAKTFFLKYSTVKMPLIKEIDRYTV